MRLKDDTDIKQSGVDWLGKIPNSWRVLRMKDIVASMGSGGTPKATVEDFYSDDGVNWVTIADMSSVDRVEGTTKHLSAKGIADKNLVIHPAGTVLYSMYATIGKVSELTVPATINQAILAIQFKRSVDKAYVKYALRAFEPWAIAETTESTQKNLNAEKVKRFSLPIPQMQSQRRIVSYLDEKTAAIDARVAVLEKKLAAYKRLKTSVINQAVTRGLDPKAKLKDSGVDWIGKVPAGWKIERIKDCFRVISGSGFKPELQGEQIGDYPVCKASDIAQANGELSTAANWLTRERVFASGFNIIPAGSTIFAKIGEAMKKNNRAYCKVDCCVDNNCQGLAPFAFDSRYGFYLLRLIDMSWFDSLGPIPCVDNKALRGLLIPCPPITEQRAIAGYLDAECAKIDKMAALVTREIELYKKLKRSLINEVVTGKRPVFADEPLRRGKEVA